MEFPYGMLLIVLSVVSLIIGCGISVIGGMLNLNQVDFVNAFLSNKDTSQYHMYSKNMIIAPNKVENVDLGASADLLSVLAIVAGILVIVYALVGIMSGILKNVSLLFLFIGTVLVSTMLQFLLIWMMLDHASSFHDQGRNGLKEKMSKEYELGPKANEFSQMMNSIMITGKCCGVATPNDFVNLTWSDMNKKYIFKVSPACCKDSLWNDDAGAYTKLTNCATYATKADIYHTGCYEALFLVAWANCVQTYVIILGILIAWQVLAVAVAVLLLFQPKDEEKMETGPTIPEGQEPVEEKKPFTPFSKLSSFQTSEVARMRSTEIW